MSQGVQLDTEDKDLLLLLTLMLLRVMGLRKVIGSRGQRGDNRTPLPW